MIKFFKTREEAIEYALKISRERQRDEELPELIIHIPYMIASGLISFN
jgi:hypothetical protein